MKNPLKCRIIAVVIFALSLGACSSTEHTQTGFLSNYQQLVPSQQYDNTNVYRANGFDKQTLAEIEEVYIAPFEVWLNKAHATAIGNANLQSALNYLNQRLYDTLSVHYQVVSEPNKDALNIKGALTQVEVNSPELSPTDFIPFRVVLNAGNAAYLAATSQQDLITQVGIEMEFSMGQPKEVVFAMTAVREMDTTVTEGEIGNAQAVKQVFDEWIDNLANTLNQINQPSS